ncbi:membrane protein insertase YidC, partial [bacterium]|nr:membrane protein insertase YidC [bacterium]
MIIGISLIALILLIWFMPSEKPETVTPADTAESTGAPPLTGETTPTPTAMVGTAGDEPTAPATPDAAPVASAPSYPPQPPVTVKSDTVEVQFTNVGARIASWKLMQYNAEAGPDGEPVEMIATAPMGKLPLATYWVGAGPQLSENLNYRIVSRDPNRVVFEREDAAGFIVRKIYTPDLANYTVKLTVEIETPAGQAGQGRLSVVNYHELEKTEKGMFKPPKGAHHLAYVAGSLESQFLEKAIGETYAANVLWAGFSDVYFLSVVAPGTPDNTQDQVVAPAGENSPMSSVLTTGDTPLTPGSKASFDFATYMGPKKEETLIAAGHNFDAALDFGWFTVISKLLVRVLAFFHQVFGNWGVAIILTTLIIKTLLLPLTQKSYKSMQEMSALQPKMKEIREKYADDREKMNQETMALYKAHGVNPAAGCVPMLLQLPIFLAFYRALYGTIELRHAPFGLWIHDLSAPDPLYITPIIMGVTML